MKIYLIGDSISVQYGPYLKQYLSGIAEYSRKEGEEEALLNLDNPQGANGGDSGMVLSFLRGKAKSGGIDADLLLVNCGLHDIKTDPKTGAKQVELPKYRENLRGIIEVARGMGVKIAWIRTTPCDEKVHNKPESMFHRYARDCTEYNRAADEVMREAGVPLVDLYTFTINVGGQLYCDHVHFHEEVRMKQAAFIAGFVVAALESQNRSKI